MITNFQMMAEQDLSHIKVAVVWPNDEHTLQAIIKAKQTVGVSPVLIGDVNEINKTAEKYNIKLNPEWIRDAESMDKAAEIAVTMAKENQVNAIMKGKVDTAVLLKAVVNSETGIKIGGTISHFVVHELKDYPKLLAMTDGGMNLYPDLKAKIDIINNGVKALHKLGVSTPNVAVLAAVEKVNPKMIETVDAKVLKDMNANGEITDCFIEGPISYDLAMNKESAEIKGYESPLTGNVDLLVVPNITVGNVLGKALVYSAQAKMAGVVIGAKVPIILTSRGSSFEEKYYSILLSGIVGV